MIGEKREFSFADRSCPSRREENGETFARVFEGGRYSGDRCRAYARQRVPILSWLPKYEPAWLAEDALAGFTVGLTAVPQGIAYGVLAGLAPEYGLYASFMASFVYIIFGSSDSITIGPTAIMATMVSPLVRDYGSDMAVLLAFLKGCAIAVLGLLHLGFLLDFISLPVITGFTAAASINIAASQFKPLLGLPGRSDDLLDSLISIFSNLGEIRYGDAVLGVATMAMLLLLKKFPGRRTGTWRERIAWTVCLARNALLVVLGTLIAYMFDANGQQPFRLTGSMGKGLPEFGPPPFVITVGDRRYDFVEAVAAMGTSLFSVPLVSMVEHMAIAKAFAMGKRLDGTQEMLALGLCNVFGSFARSMPVTGSFTRTAVNHASGVRSTLGGLFTGCLVLLASTLLISTFRLIPKATLAGVIVVAMYHMLDFATYAMLWRAKKIDFLLMLVTLLLCVFYKLEWGILIGIALNLAVLLYFSAQPSYRVEFEQEEERSVIRVVLEESVSFPAAESFRARITKLSEENSRDVLLDLKHLKRIDATVAKNLKLLANDLRLRGRTIGCVNRSSDVEAVLEAVAPDL